MFEKKNIPTVTTSDALHGVYKFFFSPKIPFCGKIFFDTSAPTMGEVGGGSWLRVRTPTMGEVGGGSWLWVRMS